MANNSNTTKEKNKKVLLPKNDIVFQAMFSKGNEDIAKSL